MADINTIIIGNDWTLNITSPGFAEITCNSWSGFIDVINSENGLRKNQNYCYRGHASENWILEPTLKRQSLGDIPTNLEAQVLDNFKRYCLGRRGYNPPALDENEWWALGQHFGLNTPLLDWSDSPFIAAYFAFNNVDNDTDNVVVWFLSKKVNENPEVAEMNDSEKIKFITPNLDENARLINQRGLFVRTPNMVCVEKWVKETIKDGLIVLAKVKIPKNQRDFALDSLDKMNINSLTLFPDLTGAAQFTNYIFKRDRTS